MSLSTIRTQVKAEVGNRNDIDSIINDQANFAISEICTMLAIKELQASATTTTTDGQSDYLLPSDLYTLWSVWNENDDDLLEEANIDDYNDYDITQTGEPGKYARYHNILYIFDAVPDATVYTLGITYWKRHPALSSDSDTHLLPTEFERGIRLLTTAYMLRILDMDEKADRRTADYQRWLGRFQTPYMNEQVESKTPVFKF